MDHPATASRDEQRTVAQRFCLGGLALAVLTMLAGAIWGRVAAKRPEMLWSAEQAAEYQAASDDLHRMEHDHGHAAGEAVGGDSATEQTAARARFNELKVQLERAQYAQNRLGPRLIQFGLAGAIAFGLGYLASRR